MIHKNLNSAGRIANMIFGLAEILDGLVRTLSFGFYHSTVTSSVSKWQAKRHIQLLKKSRK